MSTIHGTCSLCGGAVTTPNNWLGINPPIPTCSSCNAIPREPYGKVIDMEPLDDRYTRLQREAFEKLVGDPLFPSIRKRGDS